MSQKIRWFCQIQYWTFTNGANHASSRYHAFSSLPHPSTASDIDIKLHSAPHPDIPDGAKIFAQIILNSTIFLQTVPICSETMRRDRWKIQFDCNIPRSISWLRIRIFRLTGTNITRIIGTTEISLSDVQRTGSFDATRTLYKVNQDGPELVLSATFVRGPPSTFTPKEDQIQIKHLPEQDFADPLPASVKDGVEALYYRAKAGKHVDLLEAQMFHAAVLLLPNHLSETKARLLNGLGQVHSNFHQTIDVARLKRAICLYEDAIREPGGRAESTYLSDLGLCLRQCFRQLGQVADLDRAIQVQQDAVSVTIDNHPDKAGLLGNLAGSLALRFKQLGGPADLDRAIQAEDNALSLTGGGPSSDRPSHLSSLGAFLKTRFERFGSLADLNRAIQVQRDAISLMHENHPDKPILLSNLAGSLMCRFERLGDRADLNQAIDARQNAVALPPNTHPDKLSLLGNLGGLLTSRFEQFDDPEDLERAIQLQQEALSLTPNGHPDKASRLNELGRSLVSRFKRFGDLGDLHQAVKFLQDAVSLTPDGHARKSFHLDSLAISLTTRFERVGDLKDLNRAVQMQQNAAELALDHHVDKPRLLSNLGDTLTQRFQRFGNIEDLKEAIQALDDAVSLTPNGHPDKSIRLNSHGVSLTTRFNRTGDLSSLNQAVQVHKDAVSRMIDSHPDKPSLLNNLGICLVTRFEHVDDLDSLRRAVQAFKNALSLTPHNHPNKPRWLANLGSSLTSRFKRTRNVEDLNQAIEVLQEAVSLTPNSHSDKQSLFILLGISLQQRYRKQGDLSDLDQAIKAERDALSLVPAGHPERSGVLNNLGNSLNDRFERTNDIQDLNQAINILQEAVSLESDGHPNKVISYNTLAYALRLRFEASGDVAGLHAATQHYTRAANSVAGSPKHIFKAAALWLQLAIQHTPEQAMKAAEISIQLIPRLAWPGSAISDRHHSILKAGVVARDAVGAAVANGEYEKAVEWLEQGLSLVWSQVLQLRSPPLAELDSKHAPLASKLRLLSSQLGGPNPRSRFTLPLDFDYHKAAYDHDALLAEIRQKDGFDRFLLPRTFQELLPTTGKSPVVMLSASYVHSRCDALILLSGSETVLHVPLKDFSIEMAYGLLELFYQVHRTPILDTKILAKQGSRLGIVFKHSNSPLGKIDREDLIPSLLELLWNRVVHPVLEALAITSPMTTIIRRIWWCPTGPFAFLPIHAAGIYKEEKGPKLFDYVVSSYTPTLATLHRQPTNKTAKKPRLLTVALPTESQLPGTRREVKAVAEHAKRAGIEVQQLLEEQATVSRVSLAMEESSWTHFACHGTQNPLEPTESCLRLAGKSKLTLSEITKLAPDNAELAFLSACETATGDKELQDEAVHLAAGMLLAGYRGVIATMWSVNDSFTADVATKTYELLFSSKEYGADATRAAEALHFAVKAVREEKEAKRQKVEFFHWVPFMHLGI